WTVAPSNRASSPARSRARSALSVPSVPTTIGPVVFIPSAFARCPAPPARQGLTHMPHEHSLIRSRAHRSCIAIAPALGDGGHDQHAGGSLVGDSVGDVAQPHSLICMHALIAEDDELCLGLLRDA